MQEVLFCSIVSLCCPAFSGRLCCLLPLPKYTFSGSLEALHCHISKKIMHLCRELVCIIAFRGLSVDGLEDLFPQIAENSKNRKGVVNVRGGEC